MLSGNSWSDYNHNRFLPSVYGVLKSKRNDKLSVWFVPKNVGEGSTFLDIDRKRND